MNILRTLEIAWLAIAIFTFGIATYQFFSEGLSSAAFMLIGTTAASLMYIVRKKQRIKMEQRRNNPDTTAHYH